MQSATDRDSALPLDLVRRIDGICDRFEEALQAGERPQVEVFLDGVDTIDQGALLRSLLEVEVEYRCAQGERPAVEEYLRRFAAYREAVHAAFDDVGDGFDPSPEDLDGLKRALTNAANRRAHRLRIYYRGELAHTTTVAGCLELGRQRTGEEPPFVLTQGPHGPRLVVALLEETTVSRHHALLKPEGRDKLRVTNLSQVNPLLFPNGRRLETNESDTFPLTVEMTLGTIFVRIDCPAPASDRSEAPVPPGEVDSPRSARRSLGFFLRFRNRRR